MASPWCVLVERRRGRSSLVSLLIEAWIPSWRPHPHDFIYNYFPEAPPPNTIALGIRTSTYAFFFGGRGLGGVRGTGCANIQSITQSKKRGNTELMPDLQASCEFRIWIQEDFLIFLPVHLEILAWLQGVSKQLGDFKRSNI